MKNKHSRVLLFLFILLLCLPALASCKSTAEDTAILSVELKGEQILLKATLNDEFISAHAGEKIYLLALSSAYTDSLNDAILIDDGKLKSSVTFRFPLVTESGRSLLNCAFVLASLTGGEGKTAVYDAVTEPVYLSNPEELSSSLKKPKDTAGLKGLSTTDVYEAEILGAEHVLLEVAVNRLLLPSYGESAISHIYDGISYYFDPQETARLDKQIAEATALGLRVYLRSVLTAPAEDEASLKILYCNSAARGAEGYLPNMEDNSAAGYISAFYDFLASRYSGQYGLALDHVIGSSVNAFATNCNAGSYSQERILANYLSWVRTAYNTLSSHCKNSRVYVSVNNMRQTESESAVSVKAFLTSFADKARSSGDFSWSVAMDLGDGEDLRNVLAGTDEDFSTVGVNGFSYLIKLLSQEQMLYGGKTRRVIIDKLSLSHEISEANRAAYYAYAYYKTAEAGIDALIYSADDEDTDLYNVSGKRTDFYYAYLMCGSSITSQLRDYTDKLPADTLPSFKDYVSRKLIYQQEAVIEVNRAIESNKKPFPVTLLAFAAAAGAENAALGRNDADGTQILTVTGDIANTHAAISCFDIPASELIESGYVGIRMAATGANRVALVISARASENDSYAAYVCETQITGQLTTYYFNVTSFTSTIRSSDVLQVSICLLPPEEAVEERRASLEIREVALYGSSGNGSGTVITVIIVFLSTLAVCGLLFLLTRRRKRICRQEEND